MVWGGLQGAMASLTTVHGKAEEGHDGGASVEQSPTEARQRTSITDPVPEILARAEALWKARDIAAAVCEYDAALAIVTEQGGPHASETMEGQILLGKGYAILNAASATPDMRADALRCLERARDMASKSNRPQAVAFVQQLIDRGGKIHDAHASSSCEHQHGDGESCGHGVEACADHDDIGKRVAARAAAKLSREDLTSAWTSKADETLVALVASHGPRDWESMTEPLLAIMREAARFNR